MSTDWDPHANADTQRRCQNCGKQVTQQFARVFGDNDDVVHACLECSTFRTLAKTASAAGGGQ